MRGQGDVLEPQEFEIGRRRLDREGLDRRPAQMAGFQRVGQRLVVDHGPRAVLVESGALAARLREHPH